MRKYLTGFFYSLPVQLLLLHFRRYQVLLIFWYILFATVSGNFLASYGANSLYLSPEYLAKVSITSMAIVGFSIGLFVMSWNITTFILFTKHIRFLATTSQPFLKYCLNNAVLPLLFIIVYFYFVVQFDLRLELLEVIDIVILLAGFLGGFFLSVFISFAYFFGADKSIYRKYGTVIDKANEAYEEAIRRKPFTRHKGEIRVDWFLSAKFGLRKPRDVHHYSQEFLESIFKRNHFAAVIAILLAFIVLLVIGFFSDSKSLQIPAAASITLLFSILIAVSGAISLFLGSWSIILVVIAYFGINYLYQHKYIDPRNKAYGLDYTNLKERPKYNLNALRELASPENIEADKKVYLQILENWKRNQPSEKPVMFIINTSGGGSRSATFTLNVLQRLDSITNGKIMHQTMLMTGASGGMLGAAYFRELYRQKLYDSTIDLQDYQYVRGISKDLLNPLFTSLVARDIIGPIRKVNINGFDYTRDRGYAFEEKLDDNTKGVLNKKLGDYKEEEGAAKIPLIFFGSTITRDAMQMIIATHPARFLMKAPVDSNHLTFKDPDAVDFTSFLAHQQPLNLSVLSALRMNATFPFVLPNVWLPSQPVIDVMDAGLRDNFGQQTSLRFIDVFKDWLNENTSKVVLIQIRDRPEVDWDDPYQPNTIMSLVTKSFLILQNNWYNLQHYYEKDMLNYFSQSLPENFYQISFQYTPYNTTERAALSFHLTASEKANIEASIQNPQNTNSFQKILDIIK